MHRTHRREFPRARTDALRGWNRALVSATWRGLTCPFRVRACVRIWTHAGSYDFSHIDAWRMRGRVGWRVRVARGFTGLVTSTSFQTLLDAVFFFFFFVIFLRHSTPDTCPIFSALRGPLLSWHASLSRSSSSFHLNRLDNSRVQNASYRFCEVFVKKFWPESNSSSQMGSGCYFPFSLEPSLSFFFFSFFFFSLQDRKFMFIDIIITSKSMLHELFIITVWSKVRFTPVITSFTTDSLMNNLFMIT